MASEALTLVDMMIPSEAMRVLPKAQVGMGMREFMSKVSQWPYFFGRAGRRNNPLAQRSNESLHIVIV